MWPYHPELLATPVPRYTSYPTAAEFDDSVGEADQRAGLAATAADEPLSLYVHIPYCREICWYCGCNTGAANRAQRLTNYLARLTSRSTSSPRPWTAAAMLFESPLAAAAPMLLLRINLPR